MYLDPGSGSVILQVLLGVLLSVGVLARLFWGRIKTVFGRPNPGLSEAEKEDRDEFNVQE